MQLKNKYPKRHEFYRHKLNKMLEIQFQKYLCIYEMQVHNFWTDAITNFYCQVYSSVYQVISSLE